MGNSCKGLAAVKSSTGVSANQWKCVKQRYQLTDEQTRRLEVLFLQTAANKKYLTLRDFRGLYSTSRFDHDDADILAVFRALGESANASSPDEIDRITFDGFVRLTLLCRSEVTGGFPSNGKAPTGSHDNRPHSNGNGSHGNSDENENNIKQETANQGDGVDGNVVAKSDGKSGTDRVDGTSSGFEDEVDGKRMQVLFDVMDADGSGSISESEFQRFILNFVDDETTASGIFVKLDHDKSRTIDFEEFCAFCRRHRRVFRAMCSYVFPID